MSSFVPMRVAEIDPMRQVAGGGFAIYGSRSFSSQAKNPPWQKRPWRTRAIWNTQRLRWELTVYPGYVNGWDPLCDGYLPSDETPGQVREMELFDGPRIPVGGFRDVDGLEGETIPPYFAKLGVRKPSEQARIDAEGESVVIDGTPEDESLPPRRYLKAVDVWVSVARPTYRMVTTVTGNLLPGQLVQYNVTFDTSRVELVGARARLHVGPKMPARQRPDLMARLNGLYQDESEDRQLIATVFWLSQPEVNGVPNQSWRPYVSHRTGWNLLHAAKNDPPRNFPQAGEDSGLAAFVGRYTIAPQATFGAMEAEIQRLMNGLLNDTSNEGKFWTI